MNRIGTAIMIALATLVMTGGLNTDALAREPATPPVAPSPALQSVAARSGKIMSLLLTLDALRLTPGLLDGPKV